MRCIGVVLSKEGPVKKGYAAYRTVNVDTADQGKLILIAYDVAIKNCKQSIKLFDSRGEIEKRTRHIFKAQDAISELMSALNMETGEISRNLYKLYEYIMHNLVQANVKSEKHFVSEALKHLTMLRDAWNEAIFSIKKSSDDQRGNDASTQESFAVTG
ncbi:MAG: flagellar export chaperone FliS [Chitinivibrionales bacterium]|nr:flagellar export chaperone FliS [Chitinivibrionales bacterium]